MLYSKIKSLFCTIILIVLVLHYFLVYLVFEQYIVQSKIFYQSLITAYQNFSNVNFTVVYLYPTDYSCFQTLYTLPNFQVLTVDYRDDVLALFYYPFLLQHQIYFFHSLSISSCGYYLTKRSFDFQLQHNNYTSYPFVIFYSSSFLITLIVLIIIKYIFRYSYTTNYIPLRVF